jgi:predicted RNA-binding protein with PUA-like domain
VAHWLIKEEPSHYAFADLVRDGRTEWSGVHNATALQNMRRMKVGDEAFYYHTGDVRACVGIVRVATPPVPDPKDERVSVSLEVRPVRALARPVTLAEMRADPAFAGFDLLRISRLSVVSVPDPIWRRIIALAGGPAPTEGARDRGRASAPPRRARGAPRRR